MAKSPSIDLKRAWEIGAPLQQAPVRFAAPAQRAALLKYQQRAGHWGLIAAKNMLAEMTKRPDILEPGELITPEERRAHEELERSLKETVLRELTSERLLAVGYSHPRHLDDLPRRVPPELLHPVFMRWDSSRVEGNGLRFDVVRVVHAAHLFEAPDAPVAEEKKRGRPSGQPVILAAYGECKKASLINFAGKKKDAVTCVLQWIRKHKPLDYGDGKRFGAKAIELAISEDFDREKSARNKE